MTCFSLLPGAEQPPFAPEKPTAGRFGRPVAFSRDSYALHNLYTWEERPAGLEGEIFKLLFKWTEIANFAPEDQQQYLRDMTTERDIRNQIRYAHKTGVQEGEAKGFAKGIEKGAREKQFSIARAMLAKGFDPSVVSELTGLSAEELEDLK